MKHTNNSTRAVTQRQRFANPHTLMVQGTTSDAGKSILVTALCRILARHQIAVAPFKSQNMALNSAVTADGGEIGRAQAVQAQAAKLAPSIEMNPVLLKPNSDIGAQVILNGQAIGNMKAVEYHHYKPQLLKEVMAVHRQLQGKYQAVIVEGAGSPAEINLREHDIANMGFAEAVDCPVVIVADIDRGGVFAHLYGTFALLSESEQARVQGFVINRFRGDVSLLQSGLDWLEAKTGVPTLAVIPYLTNLHIEAEDSVDQRQNSDQQSFKIAIPLYPRASNHTDFDVLRLHPQLDCQFVRERRDFNGADLIILPGSKNVGDDLAWLKAQGWDDVISRHLRLGGKVLGVCGGYQMLGCDITDPQGIESRQTQHRGLGHLAISTELCAQKTLSNVTGQCVDSAAKVSGYEIHAGVSEVHPGADLAQLYQLQSSEGRGYLEGHRNADDSVRGTYIHGLFELDEQLMQLLQWAGFDQLEPFDYHAFRERQIERLADAVESVLPLSTLQQLLALDSQGGSVNG